MSTPPHRPAGPGRSGEGRTAAGLRRQARQRDLLAEQVQALLIVLHTVIATLPDRVAAADWGTDDITRAVDDLAHAAAAGMDDAAGLARVDEQLQRLQAAIAAAEQLGTRVAELGATGAVDAFLAGDGSGQAGQVDHFGDRAGRPRSTAPLIRNEPAWLFADIGGRSAARRLRVWQISPGQVVAVVTERPDDTGPSITNAIEAVAAQLRAEHPGQEVQVVEHYLPRPQSRDDSGAYERWTLTAITEDGVDQIELPSGGRADPHRQPRPGHLRSPRLAALAADHPRRPGPAHRPPSPGRAVSPVPARRDVVGHIDHDGRRDRRRPRHGRRSTVQAAMSAPDGPRPGAARPSSAISPKKIITDRRGVRVVVPLWLLDGRHV